MISGILAGLAASKYVSDTLTTISHINKASKFMSKVVYPLGIFAISSAVGNAAGKAVQEEVDSIKDTVAGVKEIGKAMREAKESSEEPETHNVFEQSEEVDENGES
jgi:hypothetical protein